ncbi:class I SAM-dependent methyltransferase [Mesorhizobium sp. CAU 1741]
MQNSPLRELYSQSQFPVFQNRMYSNASDARCCPRGDIRLVEDQQTGLIYNAAFRPDVMDYDEHYQNEQANSSHFREHLEKVTTIVERLIGLEDLVEIGCGKGFFMDMLTARGADIVGFDPTYTGNDPRVRREYFGSGTGVRGRGLVLRHVLEHIPDPVDFIFQIKEANGGQGKIYIEVPCFEWICERRAWFDIFYEHVNYFRIDDFDRIFGEVIESGHIFGGQYIYVIAELSSARKPRFDSERSVKFPSDFSNALNNIRSEIKEAAIVWGGASKGVIFSLMCERAGLPVDSVIDINPAKQGRFLAATGLEVKSPGEVLPSLADNTPIYVMNSNYLEEIKELSGNRLNYISLDRHWSQHGCG